jgi:hypothetical protein
MVICQEEMKVFHNKKETYIMNDKHYTTNYLLLDTDYGIIFYEFPTEKFMVKRRASG